jgi:hypothetical protein
MRRLIIGLYEDWVGLDERIEAVVGDVETIGEKASDERSRYRPADLDRRGRCHWHR